MVKNKRGVGSSFDEFLEQDDILVETEAVAIKRVLAWKIQNVLEEEGISKTEMAKRMGTSRSALDRFLDPENTSITLHTMERAALAVNKRIHLELVEERSRSRRKRKKAA